MASYEQVLKFEGEKPEGVIRLVEANGFYRAYNQSAYLFHQAIAQHKVTRKFVKNIGQEIDADKIQLDISGVVEKALTYKSKKRNATQGMPSVVVGPWGSCEDFIRKFSSKIEDRADREDVGYFLEHAAADAPLVRESEFAGKIHLGHCTNCNKKDACDCGYCEVKGCML